MKSLIFNIKDVCQFFELFFKNNQEVDCFKIKSEQYFKNTKPQSNYDEVLLMFEPLSTHKLIK